MILKKVNPLVIKNKKLISLFASYVIPTVFAMFISGIYQIIDGIFVGHFIGADGLAGINIGWPLVTALLGYGLMVGVGIGSLTSLAKGEGDLERASQTLGQMGVLILLPSALIGCLLYYFAADLVHLMGANVHSSDMAISFLQIFAICAPLVVGSITTPFIVRNLGAPKQATIFMAIGVILNILFSFLLMGYWQLELRGAAIASVIGETVAMILGLRYIFSKKSSITLSLRHFIPDRRLLAKICLNGVSSFFMYIYIGVIMVMHNYMFLKYGDTNAVAAYAITEYMLVIYYLIAEGIANGMQPIVSDLYGANRNHSVRAIMRMTLIVGIGFGVLFTLVLQIFPAFFVDFFIESDTVVTSIAISAVHLNLFVMFLEGFFIIAAAFFQALGEGHKALFITLGNMLIQVPFLIFMPLWIGINGVWLTMPISSIVLAIPVGIMTWMRYQKIKTI